MKSTRLAVIGAALATVASVAVATPALADSHVVQVTSLPAKATIPPGGSVSVNVPNAAVCAAGTSDLTVTVRGGKAVTPLTIPGAGCSAGQLNYSIVDNPNSLKTNGVVKFIARKADGGRVVQTLVVKVAGDQKGEGQANRRCHDHGANSCLLQ